MACKEGKNIIDRIAIIIKLKPAVSAALDNKNFVESISFFILMLLTIICLIKLTKLRQNRGAILHN